MRYEVLNVNDVQKEPKELRGGGEQNKKHGIYTYGLKVGALLCP